MRPEPDDAVGAFAAQLYKPVKPAQLQQVIVRVLQGGRRASRPADSPSVPAEQRLRVLVADDNAVNLKVATVLLERLGHLVDVAGNGSEALAAVRSRPFDLVLMDVYMPVMDGLEASRQIRDTLPAQDRPVVVALTAGAFAQERARCRDAGMEHFVAKPIRRAELEAVLHAVGSGPAPTTQDESGGASLPPVPVDEVLDGTVLAELRASLGDVAAVILPDLVSTFLTQSTDLLQQVQEAAARGDEDVVRAAAHKLRGGSATFGATALATLCQDLEEHAAASAGLVARSEALVTEFARVHIALLMSFPAG